MSAARARQMKLLRPLVFERARGVCEAGDRCPFPPDELQHALPRSQASIGDEHLLDREAVAAIDAGTFDAERHLAHLLALCGRCHRLAHSNPLYARSIGTVIPGSIRTAVDGRVFYVGPDLRLADLWPQEVAA